VKRIDHLNKSDVKKGRVKFDGFVKSLNSVTPAKAGVQKSLNLLDSGFRRNDKKCYFPTFYEVIRV